MGVAGRNSALVPPSESGRCVRPVRQAGASGGLTDERGNYLTEPLARVLLQEMARPSHNRVVAARCAGDILSCNRWWSRSLRIRSSYPPGAFLCRR